MIWYGVLSPKSLIERYCPRYEFCPIVQLSPYISPLSWPKNLDLRILPLESWPQNWDLKIFRRSLVLESWHENFDQRIPRILPKNLVDPGWRQPASALSSRSPTLLLGLVETAKGSTLRLFGEFWKMIREGVKKTCFFWDFVPNIGPHPPTAHV